MATSPRSPRFAARHLVHRGVVEASGFVLDGRAVGEGRVRERLCALWRPGCSVREAARGRWVVRMAGATEVSCEQAPGAPLVLDEGVLCGAPRLGAEARHRGAGEGAVALFEGGQLVVLGASDGEAHDPAGWLDLSAFSVLVARAPEVPPAAVAPAFQVVRADVRAVLGGKIPPPAPQAAEVARAFASGPQQAAAPSWLAVFWGRVLQTVASFLVRFNVQKAARASLPPPPPPRGGEASPQGLVVRHVEPAGSGLFERLAARFNDMAARLLLASRMASLVGRRQAEYLGDMMEMFERGNLDDALRHAIPLGSGDDQQPPGLTLGVPKPRSELSLSTGGGGASSMLPFEGVYDELRRLYRAAFEKLDGEGRVEEAAFVLAELLRESDEAVAYLERHERYRLAAELAEGRKLAPGLVVRLWFLAGDAARAAMLARLFGVFADAVVRLEKGDPERAAAMRLLWAESLASAGDLLAAVEVALPVPQARTLALGWLDRAADRGGTDAAQALVRKLSLEPGCFSSVAPRLGEIIDDRSPEAARERLAVASFLLKAEATPHLRAIATPLCRALLRDVGPHGAEPALLGDLRAFAANPVLRADWPRSEGVKGAVAAVLDARAAGASAGPSRILDAVVLPSGRFLVALGELGVRMLSRSGKCIHHFDQPASQLVVSRSGDRAIALAWRQDMARVARIDLDGRRAQPWSEAEIEACAASFDGSLWFVGVKGGVLAIDALSERWASLWSMPGMGRRVLAVEQIVGHLVVAVEKADLSVEQWRFELPSFQLRSRDVIAPPPDATPSGLFHEITPWGVAHIAQPSFARLGPGGAPTISLLSPGLRRPLPEAEGWGSDVGGFVFLHHSGDWLALSDGPLGRVLRASSSVPGATFEVRVRVFFEGAKRVVARPSPWGLALADDRGRLMSVDLEKNEIVRDLRV